MVNPDRIERYEWVCLDNTKVLPVTEFYDVLADKFEFPKNTDPIEISKKVFLYPHVTKESFDVLFINLPMIDYVDFAPARDKFTLSLQEPLTTVYPDVCLVFCKAKKNKYKCYGVYTSNIVDNITVKFKEYNPTYYKDKHTGRFTY